MDDPSFYVIDQKLVPRVDGQIPDRINPYLEEDETKLRQGWTKFELQQCNILASSGDKKCFKLMVSREEEKKGEKEQRFLAPNVCGRSCWLKKLLQAKNGSFEAYDGFQVPVEEMMAFQNEIQRGSEANGASSPQGGRAA